MYEVQSSLVVVSVSYMPHHNVWCQVICCCFTRTTMFTELFTCWYHQSYRFLSLHQVYLLYTFQLLRQQTVLPEVVYCCFTRTKLFRVMSTEIIFVCSLKSIHIPSSILIGCCVSELHTHLHVPIVMYGLRLFYMFTECYSARKYSHYRHPPKLA